MKYLLTGSCGFVFSNFVIYAMQDTKADLVSIDKVTAAGSLNNIAHNSTVYNKRHKLYIGDICDYHFVSKIFEIEKPDIVIHGAAESNLIGFAGQTSTFINTNMIGTHSLLEAARTVYTPKKFINISSDKVYGSLESYNPTEKDPLNPMDPYASTKAAADLLGQSYYTTYGLPVITTRCCNNFGPRQNIERFIPNAIISVLTGKKIPLYGTGLNKREWIYVKDHFKALLTIIESGVPGEIYNIGSGNERDNSAVLKSIFNIMGSGTELVQALESRKEFGGRFSVNSNKIRNLGWTPQYDFDEALKHLIGWYKSNHWAWKK